MDVGAFVRGEPAAGRARVHAVPARAAAFGVRARRHARREGAARGEPQPERGREGPAPPERHAARPRARGGGRRDARAGHPEPHPAVAQRARGQRVGGKWTDSPGSISPSGASGDASPGAYTPRGAASPTAIAAGLTAARDAGRGGGGGGGRGGRVHDCLALGRGAAQARVLVPPRKSRRKAEGGDAPGPAAHALPGVPVDGGGFPGAALPRAQAEALRGWRRRRVCARPAPD